jgi:hypothetical protein
MTAAGDYLPSALVSRVLYLSSFACRSCALCQWPCIIHCHAHRHPSHRHPLPLQLPLHARRRRGAAPADRLGRRCTQRLLRITQTARYSTARPGRVHESLRCTAERTEYRVQSTEYRVQSTEYRVLLPALCSSALCRCRPTPMLDCSHD